MLQAGRFGDSRPHGLSGSAYPGGTIVNFVPTADGYCEPVSAAVAAGIIAFSQAAATAWHADRIRVTAIKVTSSIAAGSQTRVCTASQVRPTFVAAGWPACLPYASEAEPALVSAIEEAMAFIRASRDGYPIAATLKD